ncbi:MAG: 16S rRNA (guanine(966)-N(2))-methyltransferase RsmD [Rhodothermales bacterium]|nr:16S rRNA (guanine(966)-N(2))-methyltransferase RsmD [Rhodothermales bacterium]
MRIIAGSLKRRTLSIPKGLDVRPTTDRVREAVFSWIVSRVDLEGLNVLDLFAGSGALAFEAISRGADEALLVEKSPRIADVIRQNADHLGISDQVRVASADALTWLGRSSAQFDLVFADPPYDYPDFESLPDAVLSRLTPDGILILEHGKPGQYEEHPQLVDQRRYGRTNVAFFRPDADTEEIAEDT